MRSFSPLSFDAIEPAIEDPCPIESDILATGYTYVVYCGWTHIIAILSDLDGVIADITLLERDEWVDDLDALKVRWEGEYANPDDIYGPYSQEFEDDDYDR